MRRVLLLLVLVAACSRSDPPEERPGMTYIPGGEFMRGSRADDAKVYPWEAPHEQPQHPVQVDAFYMDLREVTNAEFERFLPSHQREVKASPCDDCPVTEVTWFEAQAYCAALKKRLPTEAEWEKAAKGGQDEWYPESYEDYAWFSKNSIRRTQSVGQKRPNGYGLCDVLGNVREWTADWYGPDYYQRKERDNPKGPKEGQRRSERGGAFFLPARGVTTTIRYNHPPTFRLYFLGFRCAQDVK